MRRIRRSVERAKVDDMVARRRRADRRGGRETRSDTRSPGTAITARRRSTCRISGSTRRARRGHRARAARRSPRRRAARGRTHVLLDVDSQERGRRSRSTAASASRRARRSCRAESLRLAQERRGRGETVGARPRAERRRRRRSSASSTSYLPRLVAPRVGRSSEVDAWTCVRIEPFDHDACGNSASSSRIASA